MHGIPSDASEFTFSPNGKQIAFVTSHDVLRIVTIATGKVRTVAHAKNTSAVTWSPSGKELAITDANDNVDLIRPDGSGRRTVCDFCGGELAWSVRNQIASTDGGHYQGVLVISGETGNVNRITSAAHQDVDADWSPDGRRLIFDRGTLGQGNGTALYEINANGTGLKHLVTRYYADDPAFSPDGRQIVYENEKANAVWVMNANGTGQHAVTPADDPSQPQWQPLPR